MPLTKTLQSRDAEKRATHKSIGRALRSSIWLVTSEYLKLFTFKAYIMLGSKPKGYQAGHGKRQQEAQR